MDILFLCHRIPYPPDKGDKIRSFRFLQHLAKNHRVRLVTAADDPADLQHQARLEELIESVAVIPFGRAAALARAACGLATGRPLSVAWFPGAALGAAARRMAAARRPDVIFAFSSQTAPAAFSVGPPVVLDLVDKDSGKFAQYAVWARGVKRMIYRLEAARLARAEESWVRRAASSIVISHYERSLFPEALQSHIEVVGNPFRVENYSPDRSREVNGRILFAGALDYAPNVDAVTFFAREVMPRILREVPDAEFRVVGPRAPQALEALDGKGGMRLTGYVDDIAEEYAGAAVNVAPFRFTQGVLNKVIEAMACAIPVVATPEAVRGIGLEDGQGVRLGRDAAGLAGAVTDLLGGEAARRHLGAEGRAVVEARFAWPGELPRLDEILAAAARPDRALTSAGA